MFNELAKLNKTLNLIFEATKLLPQAIERQKRIEKLLTKILEKLEKAEKIPQSIIEDSEDFSQQLKKAREIFNKGNN